MRGAARGVVRRASRGAVGVATGLTLLVAGFATPAAAQAPDFARAIRDLDGAQFLEDEPIWLCDAGAPAPGPAAGLALVLGPYDLVGVEDTGRAFRPPGPPATRQEGPTRTRAGELAQSAGLERRRELHPLETGLRAGGGLRAGSYELRRVDRAGDHGHDRVIARFRVLVPRGSELAVRAALARAARLSGDRDTTRWTDAARLYEAVLDRYPRTSYRTAIYAGLWRLRARTSAYSRDPGAWLEEIFAHYNSACFGVWALDRFMADIPNDEARPRLRRLVGLYPDTMLSRAAARYL